MSSVTTTAPIAVVPVREDHLAAIMRFISVQHTVVQAAVPRHLYGLQAEAHKQLNGLLPIINTYKFAEDTITVRVDLGNGKRQKMLISQRALSSGFEEVEKDISLAKDQVRLISRTH